MMSQPGRLNSAGVSRWVSRVSMPSWIALASCAGAASAAPVISAATQQAVVSVLNIDGFRELERGGQGKLEGAPRSRAEGGGARGDGRDGAQIVLVEQVIDIEAQL